MKFFGLTILLSASIALSGYAIEYDSSIPSPSEVLGYEIGTHVTNYAGMEKYLNVLAASSPKVVTGIYGEDYEKHQLHYLIISNPDNIANLENIR